MGNGQAELSWFVSHSDGTVHSSMAARSNVPVGLYLPIIRMGVDGVLRNQGYSESGFGFGGGRLGLPKEQNFSSVDAFHLSE